MLILFVADFSFATTTTLPDTHPYAYYVGSMSDLFFASGFYVLGCGLLSIPLTIHHHLPPSRPNERVLQLAQKALAILAPQSDESDFIY